MNSRIFSNRLFEIISGNYKRLKFTSIKTCGKHSALYPEQSVSEVEVLPCAILIQVFAITVFNFIYKRSKFVKDINSISR